LCKNRILRRTVRTKRENGTAKWRQLYNEGHHNLYSSTDVIKVIRSRRMRWDGLQEMRKSHKFIIAKPERKTISLPKLRW
jgi:hypothetical protein